MRLTDGMKFTLIVGVLVIITIASGCGHGGPGISTRINTACQPAKLTRITKEETFGGPIWTAHCADGTVRMVEE